MILFSSATAASLSSEVSMSSPLVETAVHAVRTALALLLRNDGPLRRVLVKFADERVAPGAQRPQPYSAFAAPGDQFLDGQLPNLEFLRPTVLVRDFKKGRLACLHVNLG